MARATVTRGIGSAWRPRTRATRASGTLSRQAVISAAVAIVDRDGVEGLTMRRLAAELDAGVTTLYWHVADKQEMIDLVVDEIFGELELPDDTVRDWKQRLRLSLSSLRDALLQHRDLATLLKTRANVGPNALRVRELIAASLRQAGLPDEMLVLADQSLLAYTIGFAAAEAARMHYGWDSGDNPQDLEAEERAYLAQLQPEQFPALVALATVANDADVQDRFAYGLDRLLDGIESDLKVGRRRARRTRTA